MAYIKVVPPETADGELAEHYQTEMTHAGRVFNVISIQSLNPPVMAATANLFRAMMYGPSCLSRAEREMIALVVSRENECFY